MGGCQSTVNVSSFTNSLRVSPSVAIGPTPSILPRERFDDVNEKYAFEKELGKGLSGIVVTRRVRDKEENKVYACKTITKSKVISLVDLKDIQKEIKIYKYLATHPSICRFIQNYEDKDAVHLIVEECSGGDLFDRIQREKVFDELMAARAMHSIVGLVQHCHSMHVVHRDIKPESFMYTSAVPDAELKAIAFRNARFFSEGAMEELVGCPYYAAPEMLRGSYGCEVDIWSCGVLLYVLLSGRPPFDGENDNEIFEQIVSCPLDLKSAPWPTVSASAKELVRKMLIRDPRRRANAEQVLNHPWLKEQNASTASEPVVLMRMREFGGFNKLKKTALKVLAISTPEVHLEGLLHMFNCMDRDGSGHISVNEMRRSLKCAGANVGHTEIRDILGNLDLDGNHMVDYQEFLAATMRQAENGLSEQEAQELMMMTFEHFDQGRRGFISKDDVKAVLLSSGTSLSEKELDLIMAETDLNKDGKIDHQEFSAMIDTRNPRKPDVDSQHTFLRTSRSQQLEMEPKTSLNIRDAPMLDYVIEDSQTVAKQQGTTFGQKVINKGLCSVLPRDSGTSVASVAVSGILSTFSSMDRDRSSRASDSPSLLGPPAVSMENGGA